MPLFKGNLFNSSRKCINFIMEAGATSLEYENFRKVLLNWNISYDNFSFLFLFLFEFICVGSHFYLIVFNSSPSTYISEFYGSFRMFEYLHNPLTNIFVFPNAASFQPRVAMYRPRQCKTFNKYIIQLYPFYQFLYVHFVSCLQCLPNYIQH